MKTVIKLFKINSELESEYLKPFLSTWEPKISQNIVILGNNFNYKTNYNLIASQELSQMLMVPEWTITSPNIIQMIICAFLLLFSTKFLPQNFFQDNTFYYHRIILNFSYSKWNIIIKCLFDILIITSIVHKLSLFFKLLRAWILVR